MKFIRRIILAISVWIDGAEWGYAWDFAGTLIYGFVTVKKEKI